MTKIQKITRVFDSVGFNAHIDRMAEDFNKKKPYRDELKSVFLLATVLGFFANAVSIYSAYGYFENMFSVLIQSAYLLSISALVILVLLEMTTVFLILKSIKFLLHMRIVMGSIFLILAIGISLVNFYTSTTGLEKKSYDKASNLNNVIAAYRADSLRIETTLVPKIDSLSEANALLAQRTTLQNTTLIAANSEAMRDLREELKTSRENLKQRYERQLKADKSNASDTSNDFWIFVVITQFVLYASYIFKGFYYHRTHEENKSVEARVNEFSQHLINKVMVTVNELGNTAVGNYFAHTLAEAERQLSLQKPVEFEVVDSLEEKQEETTTKPKPQIVGFQAKKTSSHESSHKAKVSSHLNNEASHNQEKTMRVAIQDGDLRKLKKHATLVSHIIANTDESSSHISNSEIIHIQELATNAKNKSRSLIQNLYGIVSSIGYKKAGRIVNG